MDTAHLTDAQISVACASVYEQGSAKIEKGGLYTRTCDGADWQYQGSVEDADEAQASIDSVWGQ